METNEIFSVLALGISFLVGVRTFLLDKDYCEFSLTDRYYKNSYNNISRLPEGNVLTPLELTITLLKSDAYDINISGINKDQILPFKSNSITHLLPKEEIRFKYYDSKVVRINIQYRDSKNNLYKQELVISPIHVGYNYIDPYSIRLGIRKWLYCESMERKYF